MTACYMCYVVFTLPDTETDTDAIKNRIVWRLSYCIGTDTNTLVSVPILSVSVWSALQSVHHCRATKENTVLVSKYEPLLPPAIEVWGKAGYCFHRHVSFILSMRGVSQHAIGQGVCIPACNLARVVCSPACN